MQAQFVLASGTCWVHPRRRSNSEAGPSRDTSARPTAGLYRDAQQRMRSGRGGPSMTNRSGHHCAWRLRNGATRGLMFTTIFPIIATPDLAAALSFYRDLLGATISYEFSGPDGEPGYVGLELGTAHLGIGRDPAATTRRSERFSLCVHADDCDAAVERLRAAGVDIVEEPIDQPWGERVARVADPDGNLVIIGQRDAAPHPGNEPSRLLTAFDCASGRSVRAAKATNPCKGGSEAQRAPGGAPRCAASPRGQHQHRRARRHVRRRTLHGLPRH